jgi:putative salt-induced outer membrane protein YdiY
MKRTLIKAGIAACLMLVGSRAAFAQDYKKELEKSGLAGDPCAKKEIDPAAWSKTAAFGVSYTDGNSASTVMNFNAQAARNYNQNVWNFLIDGNYGDADSKDTTREKNRQDFKAEAQYKRLLDERLYAMGGLSFFNDDIADVDHRVIGSPAIGYFFLIEAPYKLSAEVGPSYVFERVGREDDDYLAPRIGERFDWAISPTAKLFQTAEMLMDATDSQKYLLNSTAGIAVAINSSLSLVVSIRDYYNSDPAPDKSPNDVALITGVQVTL